MKTIKIDGAEYRFVRFDGDVIPYARLAEEYMTTPPANVEEAKKRSRELKVVMDEMFKLCLDQPPKPEHRWPVFLWLIDCIKDYTTRAARIARKFRGK